jgi:hypothetical protein
MSHNTRRRFLQSAAAGGALAGLGDLGFLSRLPRVSAAETALDSKAVRFQPDIEPLVRLLEETPRNKLLEEFGQRIRSGLSYREVLATLLLAGVRNVQPRPSVGFKFHAVLVVNSAHLASLASPEGERWLPIFWALDYFKSAQARDVSEGDWTMSPVREAEVPPADKAQQAFLDAMQRWDVSAADVAVAGFARSAGAQQVFGQFALLGARDMRSIGHKAIFVANSWRTLQAIGWRYSEPVLRSLAYALLAHQGEPNPAENDLPADQPWRANQQRARKIPATWRQGKPNSDATKELLATLRTGGHEDACGQVVEMLSGGVAVESIYDALFLGAGELLMRQPGIVGLHTLTTTNALHYAFRQVDDDLTRRLILLQNAAFLPMFRDAMHRRGKVGELQIDGLEPESPAGGDEALADIFRDVSDDRHEAARKVLGYLQHDGSATNLIDGARRLVFLKGTDSHDYKFSSAVLEDYYHVSPEWRNRFLSASVYHLRGSRAPDNRLVKRTRAALVG